MAQQIGQQGDIITFAEKIFCKAVAEGVGIDKVWVDVVADSQIL